MRIISFFVLFFLLITSCQRDPLIGIGEDEDIHPGSCRISRIDHKKGTKEYTYVNQKMVQIVEKDASDLITSITTISYSNNLIYRIIKGVDTIELEHMSEDRIRLSLSHSPYPVDLFFSNNKLVKSTYYAPHYMYGTPLVESVNIKFTWAKDSLKRISASHGNGIRRYLQDWGFSQTDFVSKEHSIYNLPELIMHIKSPYISAENFFYFTPLAPKKFTRYLYVGGPSYYSTKHVGMDMNTTGIYLNSKKLGLFYWECE
jgi:hypothetical protein